MKICSKCGVEKPLDQFYRAKERLDGHRVICKACSKVNDNTPARKAYFKKYSKSHPKKTGLKGRFRWSVKSAQKRKLDWTISWEEYRQIVANPCYYHGGKVNESGVGLDRLDNSRGYHLDNVVPCCSICNISRNRFFTPAEMLKIGKVIAEIISDRGCVIQNNARTPRSELRLIVGGKSVH